MRGKIQMVDNEWRIILARVRALSVFLCAIAAGYFVFTPSASERSLAAVFALGGLLVVGWTWRKLSKMEE